MVSRLWCADPVDRSASRGRRSRASGGAGGSSRRGPCDELAEWGPAFLGVFGGIDGHESAALNRLQLEHVPETGEDILGQLHRVRPSRDGDIEYRPCRILLKDGSTLDHVYVVEAEQYIRLWGSWPKHDVAKSDVSLNEITRIEESPQRLPAPLATKMYQAGESATGGCFFVLVLRDGRRLPYATGNAVDFLEYPPRVSQDDVVELLPHARGDPGDWRPADDRFWIGAGFARCLYCRGGSS